MKYVAHWVVCLPHSRGSEHESAKRSLQTLYQRDLKLLGLVDLDLLDLSAEPLAVCFPLSEVQHAPPKEQHTVRCLDRQKDGRTRLKTEHCQKTNNVNTAE